MPEIRDYYVHVKTLELAALHQRKGEILASTNGDFKSLPDDPLIELLAINRELRKRAAVPSKRSGVSKADKQSASMEDLL